MKLKSISLLLLLGLGAWSASAQETPRGYLQLQAGAAHTVGEAAFKELLSPAAALSAGYRFTPLWGVRAGIGGWQGKDAWVSPFSKYKFNYLQGNVDATLNLTNLFGHPRMQRPVDVYLLAGVGLNGAFSNDEAVALDDAGYRMAHLWRGSKVGVAGRAGLGTNIWLGKRVAFNLEVNANLLSDKFNSKKAGNADWQFNALAGLTFRLGKGRRQAAPVAEEPQTVPAQPLTAAREVPAPVAEPAPVKEEAPAAEPLRENIFFTINSSAIRSSETAKVERLVSYLQQHADARVSLCGYADAATGTAAINERLSRERAHAVRRALEAKGIAPQRISIDFKGDKVQPFAVVEENRVTVCIAVTE